MFQRLCWIGIVLGLSIFFWRPVFGQSAGWQNSPSKKSPPPQESVVTNPQSDSQADSKSSPKSSNGDSASLQQYVEPAQIQLKEMIERMRDQMGKQLDPNQLQGLDIDPASVERVNRLMKSPATAKLIGLLEDERFVNSAVAVAESPNKKKLIFLEIIFALLIFFFKSWKYSQLEQGQFLKRCWIGLWTTGAYVLVAFLVLPTWQLGSGYLDLISGISKLL